MKQVGVLLGAVLILGAGCSGINATGTVSPATFLLPGLGQTAPPSGPPPMTTNITSPVELVGSF